MGETEPLFRNISDTARWVAIYRARESERPDALFRDPFARRLAGERGEQIVALLPASNHNQWAWAIRTYLFDRLITQQVAQGVDLIVNLAAGLDARPYRMELPAALQWVEVDLPELVAYKTEILKNEKPRCSLDRVSLDLASGGARRELFAKLGQRAKKAMILTEGLLVYLTAEEAGVLADDLARPVSFQRWAFELPSPGLLRRLKREWGADLGEGGAPLKFAPEEGPGYFTRHGWRPLEVHSMIKTAARLGRLSLWMRLLSLLPESSGRQGSRPWAGVCLLERAAPPAG
jgi:methyltransferase (TIGR00027 family)